MTEVMFGKKTMAAPEEVGTDAAISSVISEPGSLFH